MFEGKSIVITGASTGIGRQLALDLARRGACLTLAARTVVALEAVAAACRAAGGEAQAVGTDVADPAACAGLIDAAVNAFGRLDVLINNAGITMRARFDEITDLSLFERLMRVNYLGAVHCTHHALPHLVASRGLVVAVSSLTGKTGVPTRTGYGASKHAMQGFFDALRVEQRNTGVDVLVVSPGFVETGIRSRALDSTGSEADTSAAGAGARRMMTVETCSRLIVDAMAGRRRELVMTASARLGMWLKLIAPGFVDRMSARAIGDHGGRTR